MYITPPAHYYYQLNGYFNNLKEAGRKYPKLASLFKGYEEKFYTLAEDLVKNYSYENELKEQQENKQKYQRDIILGDNDFFKMIWYIPDAMKIIKRDKIKPELRRIDSLHIDKSEVDYEYLKIAINNKKPVLLVDYEAFKFKLKDYQYFIIDGSHRAIAKQLQASKKGVQDPVIKAYQLDPVQTMECMYHDVHRLFYKLHFNINKLTYLSDQGLDLESEEVSKELYIL